MAQKSGTMPPSAPAPTEMEATLETRASVEDAAPVAEEPTLGLPTEVSAPAPVQRPSVALPAFLGLIAGAVGGLGAHIGAPMLNLPGLKPLTSAVSPANTTNPVLQGLIERLDKAEASLHDGQKREASLQNDLSNLKTALATESDARKAASAQAPAGLMGNASGISPAELESVKARLDATAKAVEQNAKALPDALGAFTPKMNAVTERVETLGKSLAILNAREELTKASSLLGATDYLASAFQSGEPLSAPLNALKSLGASAEILAPFAPFAEKGAPKAAQLLSDLKAQMAKEPKSEITNAPSSFLETLKAKAASLVEIRKTGDTPASDDASLLAQSQDALLKNDLSRALASLSRLSADKAAPYASLRQMIDTQLSAAKALPILKQFALAALAKAGATAGK